MADTSPPAGPSDRAGPRIGKPGYARPNAARMDFAAKRLAEIEQYFAPRSAVLVSLFIRAMLARNCTTAEGMWAVYRQFESGRYDAHLYGNLPSEFQYIVGEGNEPAGLAVAPGILHIDGEAGDWGMWALILPGRDQQAASLPFGIDSTPALPQPPASIIQAAAQAIPRMLANVEPRPDGSIELVASDLAARLRNAGHVLSAAQWSIHEAIQAGRLRPGLIEEDMPSWGVSGPGGMVWHGGERVTIAIPEAKPTPFDYFKVIATDALWGWWRSANQPPAIGAEVATKEAGVLGPANATAVPRCNPRTAPPPAVRNWLIARYLSDPTPGQWKRTEDSEPEQIVCARFDDLTDRLLTAGVELAPNLDTWKAAGWIEDMRVDLTPTDDPADSPPYYIARLNLPPGRHRLVGIRRAAFEALTDPRLAVDGEMRIEAVQVASTNRATASPRRSTQRGEARVKLIAALTKHHRYAEGSCLNLEPIGNNALARLARVAKRTASAFFEREFQGHAKYMVMCNDAGRLAAALKLLRGEFTPQILYGAKPLEKPSRAEDRDDE